MVKLTAVSMHEIVKLHVSGVGWPYSRSAGVSIPGEKRGRMPGICECIDSISWTGSIVSFESSSFMARLKAVISPITKGVKSLGDSIESKNLTMISGPIPHGSPIVIAILGGGRLGVIQSISPHEVANLRE